MKKGPLGNVRRLIKWAFRAYVLYKLAKTLTVASNRNPQQNLQAALKRAKNTKELIMNLHGSGRYLNPANQEARDAARARNPIVAGMSALLGAAKRTAAEIGEWEIGTDKDGNLVASAEGEEPTILARRKNKTTPPVLNGEAAPQQPPRNGNQAPPQIQGQAQVPPQAQGQNRTA